MEDDQFRILIEYLQYSWTGYRKVRKGVKRRIQRHMQQFEHLPALDLLATDRHPQYLERARNGIYNHSSLKEVAPDWREIYFESRKGTRHFGQPVAGRASNHRVSGVRIAICGVLKPGT